ncbi:MAG: 50S ribosomal protein L23 [Candidatus Aenigmatarchaeota archaeon]
MKQPMEILKYPHLTEKSVGMVEDENKLVFVVDEDVDKDQIKWAVEEEFDVTVVKINSLIDSKGRKRAFVKLSEGDNAIDIATRLGML